MFSCEKKIYLEKNDVLFVPILNICFLLLKIKNLFREGGVFCFLCLQCSQKPLF